MRRIVSRMPATGRGMVRGGAAAAADDDSSSGDEYFEQESGEPPPAQLVPGTLVVISGIVSKPEVNGKLARVAAPPNAARAAAMAAADRVGILVVSGESAGTAMSVKRANLSADLSGGDDSALCVLEGLHREGDFTLPELQFEARAHNVDAFTQHSCSREDSLGCLATMAASTVTADGTMWVFGGMVPGRLDDDDSDDDDSDNDALMQQVGLSRVHTLRHAPPPQALLSQ